MMKTEFLSGVNCTMLTPYTTENRVDFHALEAMLPWYLSRGCSSFFAMCHSTELHLLSMAERLDIIRFVKQETRNLIQPHGGAPDIIAAGTFSAELSAMADEVCAVAEAGADAVVWITNRLDPDRRGDECWRDHAQALLEKIPEDIALGLYECPFPYKRLLTLEDIRWAASTGRFYFIKDTCCDPDMLRERLSILRGGKLKLFNANAQTLLYSLRLGAAGYSSVMANVHPQLYAWLCANFERYPEMAERLQQELSFSAFTECLSYPLTAKYVMRCQGVPVEINSRVRPAEDFTPYHALIMDQLMAWTEETWARLPHEGKNHAHFGSLSR